MKRNEIFSAFKHGLSNSDIARLADCSRTTVVGLRKLYDATLDDKENPEALQDLILTKPTYKPREKVYHVLTDEMRKIIDEELEKNTRKIALGQRKQLKKVQDNNHTFQDLCSSVQVAKMKGIRDINVDSLKSVLADCKKMVEVIQMPWTQTIESGSTQNFATLRRLFNTNSQKQS